MRDFPRLPFYSRSPHSFRHQFSLKRLFNQILAGTLITVVMIPAVAMAETLISQSYTADTAVPAGSIVSLVKDTQNQVSASKPANVSGILGVVIDGDNSQVTLTSDQKNQVQVATSGLEQVLVSDINGNIKSGDQITASPISGVGMKATASTKVVGSAQDDFPNSTAKSEQYKDKDGKQQSVKLGQIPVLVNASYYYKQPDKTIIPAALQNLANSLAGKTVEALPILISAAIFIVTLIVVVSIIYAMIHSSIISVGRNPMAQSAVYRNVIQLSLLVIAILAVAVVSIDLVLRKF